jgi:hypothetical protein
MSLASATRFGVQSTPLHEVFNDYFAKVDGLDIKAVIARGYEYHEAG